MGVAALVLGIITIIFSFLPFIKIVAIITGILSLIFGIIDLIINKENGKKFSKSLAGIILALCSVWIMLISTIFSFIMLFAFIEDYDNCYDCEYYNDCYYNDCYYNDYNCYYNDYNCLYNNYDIYNYKNKKDEFRMNTYKVY